MLRHCQFIQRHIPVRNMSLQYEQQECPLICLCQEKFTIYFPNIDKLHIQSNAGFTYPDSMDKDMHIANIFVGCRRCEISIIWQIKK